MKKRHEQKLLIVSLVLMIALNVPILLIFDVSDRFLGLPILYFYIFFIWLLAALVSLWILNKYYE